MGLSLEPAIAVQVAAVRDYQEIEFGVEDVLNGSEVSRVADRFVVVVPVCQEKLRWQVVYNSKRPNDAPDIIFAPEDDKFQPLLHPLDAKEKKAWAILTNWSVRDPARLLRLLVELRALYLQHQRRVIETLVDERIRFETSTIGNMEGLEMYLVGGKERPHEVQISVPLSGIDLSGSTAIGGRAGPLDVLSSASPQKLTLLARFLVAQGQRSPQLQVVVPAALRGTVDFGEAKLPPWEDGMCTLTYLPVLLEHLSVQLREAILSLQHRRTLLEALPAYLGRPLEVDTVNCRRISLLVTFSNFMFLVHVALPSTYPKDKPTLTFQSAQYFDLSLTPLKKIYTDYPWSPRWDADEMARRFRDYITEESGSFKRFCLETLNVQQQRGR